MKLLANELLTRYPDTPLYILTGWEKDVVTGTGGWVRYLERNIGIPGDELDAHPCFILLDEAQDSYWDLNVWVQLFKSIERSSAVHFALFTCYASTGMAQNGDTQAPMRFDPDQQISFRPKGIHDYPGRGSIGLVLDKNEAYDVLDKYVPIIIPNGTDILTKELKRGLFLASGGHAGIALTLIRW